MLTREFPHHEVRPLGGLLRLSRWVPDRLALRAVHIAGDPTLLLRPCVGVIGSRTASPG